MGVQGNVPSSEHPSGLQASRVSRPRPGWEQMRYVGGVGGWGGRGGNSPILVLEGMAMEGSLGIILGDIAKHLQV